MPKDYTIPMNRDYLQDCWHYKVAGLLTGLLALLLLVASEVGGYPVA